MIPYKKILLFLVAVVLLYAQAFSARLTYRAAMSAFNEKDYYTARLLLQEIVHKDPLGEFGDDSAYHIGLTYFYEGKYPAAIFELNLLGRDYPDSPFAPNAEFYIAESHYYSGKLPQALQMHHNFVREYPEHSLAPRALHSSGYIYLEQKKYDMATADFERAIREYPSAENIASLRLQLGIAWYNLQDYPKAKKEFEILIAGADTAMLSDAAAFWFARCEYAEGNFSSAKDRFAELAETYPDSVHAPEALYFAALSASRIEDSASSLQYLRRIENDYLDYPQRREVYFRIGQIEYAAGRPSEAETALRNVFSAPGEASVIPSAADLLAEILTKQNRAEDILKLYDQVLKVQKDNREKQVILSKKASLLYNLKRYEESAEVYETALSQTKAGDSDEAELTYLHAQSLYRSGLTNKAKQSLNLLHKIFPSSPFRADAYYLAGEIDYYSSDFDSALQNYQKVIRFYPSHARSFEAAMGIGWTYFEMKQYARSADQFRSLFKTANTDTRIIQVRMALASAEYNLQRFDKAVSEYKAVIQKKEQFPEEAQEASFQLAWIDYRNRNYDKSLAGFMHYRYDFPEGKRIQEARYFQAWSHYRLGETEAARSLLQAITDDSTANGIFHARAVMDIARMDSGAKKFENAAASSVRYLSLYPQGDDAEEAHFILAGSYIEMNRMEEANTVYEQLTASRPGSSYRIEILRELSDAYRRQKQYEKASEILKQMEGIVPDTGRGELELSRASMLAEKGDITTATGIYRTMLASGKKSDAAWKGEALLQYLQLLLMTRDFASAIFVTEEYKNAVDDDYVRQQVQLFRGKALTETGDYKAAVETLLPLRSNPSFSAEARFSIAAAYSGLGNREQALDYYLQVAAAEHPLQKDAMLKTGELYLEMEDYEKAQREFARLVYTASDRSDLYEKAIYYSAYTFYKLKRTLDGDRMKNKLKTEFPQSLFIKKIEEIETIEN